ncbi:tripartite tricarboxylate transporter substrate binding protein [Pigmentiphaga soli]|uniref:Tripartite tricarboxylate transporter substrate binding protein n=1 Tax=Pigmentiphaga soli TaxID=1007095 RepID=A0ABP8GFS1_9BURK
MSENLISILRGAVSGALLGLCAASAAAAADYPKPGQKLTVVVPWDAGGGVDVSMRLLQPALAKELGMPVQIVNMPGGGSQAGLTRCMAAAPDGYTLCATSLPSTNLTYLIPERKAPYKRESFVPVATFAFEFGSILVTKDSPYKTVSDLVDDARKQPGKIRIGNAGRYTNAHIDLLSFERATGVSVAPVFFSGGAPGVTALLGHHIEALSSTPSNYMGQYKSGDVRVLAVMADEPSALLPGVPTFASAGYKVNGFTTRTLSLPPGVPADIAAKVEGAIRRAVNTPEFQRQLAGLGAEFRYMDGAQSADLWKRTDADLTALLAREAK